MCLEILFFGIFAYSNHRYKGSIRPNLVHDSFQSLNQSFALNYTTFLKAFIDSTWFLVSCLVTLLCNSTWVRERTRLSLFTKIRIYVIYVRKRPQQEKPLYRTVIGCVSFLLSVAMGLWGIYRIFQRWRLISMNTYFLGGLWCLHWLP
jgi:hypothetical protein